MVQTSKIFSLIALMGFVASLIAHLAGYAGIEKPFGFDPWPLHLGLFIVWLPAVLAAQKLSKGFPQNDMWTASLRGCPNWMRYTLFIIFGYAFISFSASFIFFISIGSSPDKASAIREFSGHWLIFYFAAFSILHSYAKVSESDTMR